VTTREGFSLRSRGLSFRFAFRGVAAVLTTQHNAWIHAAATVVVVGAGLFFGVSRLEWCLLVLAMVAVWSAEALNTAVEALGNALSADRHPLVAQAKDAAAGAVLIAAVGAAIIGLLVFLPPLLRMTQLVP